jgi:hypothetical protein
MTLQTWILIAAVFAAVVLTRLGRHRYTRRQRTLTLVVVAVLLAKYVRGMPTTGHDLALELGCVAVGALFGIGMLAATSVGRDERSGQIWVRAGLAYMVLWVVMLGTRIAFAYSATGWARSDIGHFFASNHLSPTAVTPAFVLMTIGSLAVVSIGTAIRASTVTGAAASVPVTSASASATPASAAVPAASESAW